MPGGRGANHTHRVFCPAKPGVVGDSPSRTYRRPSTEVWLIRDTAFNNQGPSTLRKLDLNSVRVSAIGGHWWVCGGVGGEGGELVELGAKKMGPKAKELDIKTLIAATDSDSRIGSKATSSPRASHGGQLILQDLCHWN